MNRPLIEIWCTKKEAWSRCDTCDGVWWTSIPAGGCDVAGLATGGGDTSAISSPVGQFLYRSSNTSSNFFAMPTTSCVSGLYLNKGGSFWVLLQFWCTQCLVFKWFEWLDIRLIGWPVPIAYLTENCHFRSSFQRTSKTGDILSETSITGLVFRSWLKCWGFNVR